MANTLRRDKNGKVYKESLKKREAHYKCKCERCVGKNNTIEKIAEKELKTEIKDIENYRTIHENKNDLEQFYSKPIVEKIQVPQLINNLQTGLYKLDRFTILPNGETLEDLDGEYVLFYSVLNLFAPKNK